MSSEENKKYLCPCCGYKTLSLAPPNTFEICPVCFWEDDGVQFTKPDYAGGANRISLNEAKINFLKYGAISEKFIINVRKPKEEEL